MLLNAEREPHVLALDDMDPLTMTGQVLFIHKDCLESTTYRYPYAGGMHVPRYHNSYLFLCHASHFVWFELTEGQAGNLDAQSARIMTFMGHSQPRNQSLR